jgi:hypothetical protein
MSSTSDRQPTIRTSPGAARVEPDQAEESLERGADGMSEEFNWRDPLRGRGPGGSDTRAAAFSAPEQLPSSETVGYCSPALRPS